MLDWILYQLHSWSLKAAEPLEGTRQKIILVFFIIFFPQPKGILMNSAQNKQ